MGPPHGDGGIANDSSVPLKATVFLEWTDYPGPSLVQHIWAPLLPLTPMTTLHDALEEWVAGMCLGVATKLLGGASEEGVSEMKAKEGVEGRMRLRAKFVNLQVCKPVSL